MTIQSATPYLILHGQVKQAFDLYARAFGATVVTQQTFGEVDGSCPEARRDLVMHAELQLGEARIMLSDGPGPGIVPSGGVVSVAIAFGEAAAMRKAYDVLAEKGRAVHPIFDAPWGGLFGVVADALHVEWMFTAPSA